MKLLYVEDETDARTMVTNMFSMNYPHLEILSAENGAVGLELFRAQRPQVVMTDINMPIMDGIGMAKEIKAISPETVIVAVTAYTDTPYLLSAIELGIHHYVLKPINYEELFAVADKIFEEILLRRLVKEQEERIKRSEQQLSEAQKITHLGSWEWDLASGAVVWSDELYRICGFEPRQPPATPDTFLERVRPEDREAVQRGIEEAREKGSCPSLVFRVERPDGALRTVRGQGELVKDAAGAPASLVFVCLDVTELSWAQEALHASEERFSRIFHATPAFISITSVPDGVQVEVNEAFLQGLGFKREEVIGRSLSDLGIWVNPSEQSWVQQQLRENGQVREVEVTLRTRGGRILYGIYSADILEMNEKQFVLGLFNDISERRYAEAERDRLASIVESSDDAIVALDLMGVITSWNPGAEKTFGYRADEIIGEDASILTPVECREELAQLSGKVAQGEAVMQYETVRLRKDGRRIRVSLTLSPLRDFAGGIVGSAAIARDVTRQSELEQAIKYQAYHDTLTDLPNRQLFQDFLALELAQARRNRKSLAILFLDLDRFKNVNDTLGHDAGDELLKEVARRIRGCIRVSDTVARIGGDEFNILMPDLTQTDDVGIVVRKIMGVFEVPFVLSSGAELYTTTSIGVSMYPDDGQQMDELMKKADSAMYIAKQTSGNACQFYNSEINTRTVRRRDMENQLRLAVGKGEMELLFQPQVRVDTRALVGVEALLRWRHPQSGLLLPSHFLNVAEETGAIVPIGEWVIYRACSQARLWKEKGYPFGVTVNLSRRQFHQPNLLEMVARVLRETGLDPELLELEVSEDSIMGDIELSLQHLRGLKDMGVTLSLDDFGSGSSSLQWIKQLPVRRVSIDKSFINGILTDPYDLAVVNAVIAMSHNLKMTVTAEGVESEEQFSVVRKNGCDAVQGNLISVPLSSDDFESLAAGAWLHS